MEGEGGGEAKFVDEGGHYFRVVFCIKDQFLLDELLGVQCAHLEGRKLFSCLTSRDRLSRPSCEELAWY